MITQQEMELIETIADFKERITKTSGVDEEWYQEKIDELEDLLEIIKENKGTL